jgi:hypothetical protein
MKPSYEALRDLVKGEWWLNPTSLRTDAEGQVAVSGFTGQYQLGARGGSAAFSLPTPGAVTTQVRLP